jgi:hypothetical protein
VHSKRVIIWNVVLAESERSRVHAGRVELTGMELRPASTNKNLPNPPAGSKAILRGPPTPASWKATFHAWFTAVPLNRAAPSVWTKTVGTQMPT